MKRQLIPALMILASLASCKKVEDTFGQVSFSLQQETDIIEVTKSTLGDYTTLPSASDFTINVKNGQSSVWTGPVSEYDTSKKLNAGNYSVDAFYGTEGEEGFNKPYFTGSQTFAINEGAVTNVSIPVSLGNTIVKIACSDAFKNYFPDYSFTLTTGSGTVIPFPKSETRGAFIEAFKFSVSGVLTSQAGQTVNVNKEFSSSVNPATCYTVRFDVNNVGGFRLTVSFNNVIETVDMGDIELND